MITLEKPGSPEEVLEHHGVLGLKWGVDRARASGSDIRIARSNIRISAEHIGKARKAARRK